MIPMRMHDITQQAASWSKIMSSTAPEGILHAAMRHVAGNLADMVGRPIKINNVHIKTLPISLLGAFGGEDLEAETVGIYLLISEDLPGEAILILPLADAMYLADWLLEARPGTTT